MPKYFLVKWVWNTEIYKLEENAKEIFFVLNYLHECTDHWLRIRINRVKVIRFSYWTYSYRLSR